MKLRTEERYTKENILDFVHPIPECGCWIWDGPTFNKRMGYGQLDYRLNGVRKNCRAHRFVYELFHGKIDSSKLVLHTCDIPSCVNPAHLYLGTAKDNSRDIENRGRKPKSGCFSSLTSEYVSKIRDSIDTGISLSKQYGVSPATISRIKTNKTWRKI